MKRWIIFFVLAVAGCLTPTLPLPPPEAPEGIGWLDEADGVWQVRGHCTPGALVLVRNVNTGKIVGVEDRDADGRYFVEVLGEICDAAEVSQVIDDDVSGQTFFVLEPTVNGLPTSDVCSMQ